MGSRSREGAWIEICQQERNCYQRKVAPVRERGLKYYIAKLSNHYRKVAPVRERGLKSLYIYAVPSAVPVAPVRERGLKFVLNIC